MRLGLLVCDHVAPELRATFGDYPEIFAAMFARHAPEVTLQPYDVVGGAQLPAPDAADAFLTTGSSRSVNDDEPWIRDLEAFVRQLDRVGRPFVGICFGHQLLAKALGGRVGLAPQGWGVGVHRFEVTAPAPWMTPPLAQLELLMSCQEQVLEPPPGSVTQTVTHAGSDFCPHAVISRGCLLGIQAHPEFPPAYAAALLERRRARIGSERVTAALATLERPTHQAEVTRWLLAFVAARLESADLQPTGAHRRPS